MKTIDDATLRQWLDEDLDGELGGDEKVRLTAALAVDTALQAERQSLAGLHAMLATDRIAVRPAFKDEVLAALPPTRWAASQRAAWQLPVALLAVLTIAAGFLLAQGSGMGQTVGTALALFDFMQAAVLAGAGLIGASWRGAGLVLEELFARSEINLVALGLGVICLNLLFVHLLRRPTAKAAMDGKVPTARRDSQ